MQLRPEDVSTLMTGCVTASTEQLWKEVDPGVTRGPLSISDLADAYEGDWIPAPRFPRVADLDPALVGPDDEAIR